VSGAHAVQLAGVLAKTFDEGVDEAAAGLFSLGYDPQSAAQALGNVFVTTAEQAAQIFKDVFNYTAAAIAGILQRVYNIGDEATAAILQAVDFSVDEVASALETSFDDTAQLAAITLDFIGYASLGGDFASFGQSVANCFTSFFSDC
jgi:hypothetical protein